MTLYKHYFLNSFFIFGETMGSEKYSKNNLNEVIFQIRFSPLLSLYTDKKDAASKFQDYILEKFPEVTFEHNKKVKVNIDVTGKTVESKTDDEFLTWIFSSEGKTVKLNGKELLLSYSGGIYKEFSEFIEDVDLILDALNQYHLPKIKFIGLRYINQIKIADESLLDEYINPNLHLINKEFDNEKVIQSMSRTELKIDDYDLAFQYGQFNPDYPNRTSKKEFILDYDCILNNDEDFENIRNNLIQMHEIISNRFENDILERLREEMR